MLTDWLIKFGLTLFSLTSFEYCPDRNDKAIIATKQRPEV